MNWESSTGINTLPRVKQPVGSCCLTHRQLSSGLCGDLGGATGMGGRQEVQEVGIYVYIQLIHFHTAETNTTL